METKLNIAFKEFIDDLKNVTKQQLRTDYTSEEIKKEFEKTERTDINYLQIFDIPVGKIYQCSGTASKKAIEKHIQLLQNLSKDETKSLDILPIANLLNSDNLNKITDLITSHKQETDTVGTLIKKVANDPNFEGLANDMFQNFLGK
jgi:hypothetical protein